MSFTRELPDALPGTTTGPLSPPSSKAAPLVKSSPPLDFLGLWQRTHFSWKMGAMRRMKYDCSCAARAAPERLTKPASQATARKWHARIRSPHILLLLAEQPSAEPKAV